MGGWLAGLTVQALAAKGNAVVNAELEYHVPPSYPKPRPATSAATRDRYIRAKCVSFCHPAIHPR